MVSAPAAAIPVQGDALPAEMRNAEAARIALRREEAIKWGYPSATQPDAIHGLALSGGGIRAAFIARGLMERLAAHAKLSRFDYLSSVSGGGYAACMFTEHVGTQCLPPRFDAGRYKLAAPPYRLPPFLLGLVLDPAINFLPIIAYLSLSVWFPFSHTPQAAVGWLGIVVVLLCAMFAVHFVWWRWVTPRSRKATASFANTGKYYQYAILLFMAVIAIDYVGYPIAAGSIAAIMVATELFVASRPHRFYQRKNPAFSWLFVALLAIPITWLGKVSAQQPLVPKAALIISLFWLLACLTIPIVAHNRVNLIFRAYRQGLATRFLPFSTWRTGNYRLHESQQSWNPYPIINASANFGSTMQAFELAPLYCGCARSGFFPTRDWLPTLTLADAMAISGGAADFMRKSGTVSALMGAVLSGTSFWIPKDGKAGPNALLGFSRLATLVGADPRGAIGLSDGGFVDNLGVLALVKWRVDLIVCLDAGFDPDYNFDDLRQLCLLVPALGLGAVSVPQITVASQLRRFRQNTSNILVGTIDYPALPHAAAKQGIYLHIKISGAQHNMTGKYPGFPHLPTVDQGLNQQEIADLHRLGEELGNELCIHDDFKSQLH